MKEQISNLSSLLPGIFETGLSSKRLVIETIPCYELLNYPFEKLFQFSNNSESSKLVDARQVNTAVGPSNQGHADKQLSYVQDTIESVQNMCPGSISESLQSRSPSADIDNGGPSSSVTDYSECARKILHQHVKGNPIITKSLNSNPAGL